MRRGWITWMMALLMVPFMAQWAAAKVDVHVNLSSQRMTVKVDGKHYATWPVSTGRREYYTPRGSYRPKWLKKMHYSRKYDNAPMPYSIFFRGGYAIHGTGAVGRLGAPASHGCVRLSVPNAAKLFSLVQKHGRANTRIRITGSTDVAYASIKPKKRVKKRRVASRKKLRRSRKLRRYARVYRKKARKARRSRRAARRATRRASADPYVRFFQVYGALAVR